MITLVYEQLVVLHNRDLYASYHKDGQFAVTSVLTFDITGPTFSYHC